MQEKTLNIKGRQAKAFPDLIKQVMEAAKEGWEPLDDFETVNSCRMYGTNWFQVKLVNHILSEEGASISDKETAAAQEEPAVAPEGVSPFLDDDLIEFAEDSPVDTEDKQEYLITGEPVVKVDLEVVAEEVAKSIKLERIEEATTKKELLLLGMTFNIEVDKKANVQKLKKILREAVNNTDK